MSEIIGAEVVQIAIGNLGVAAQHLGLGGRRAGRPGDIENASAVGILCATNLICLSRIKKVSANKKPY